MLSRIGLGRSLGFGRATVAVVAFACAGPLALLRQHQAVAQEAPADDKASQLRAAEVMLALAQVAEQKGQDQRAVQAALEALEKFEAAVGKSHPRTRAAAELLVRVLPKIGRQDVANEVTKRFLSGPDTSPAPAPSAPSTPPAPSGGRMEELNKVFNEAMKAEFEGRFADAAKAFERLLGMLESDGQGADEKGRGVRQQLAMAYLRLMQYAKAEPLLRRNVELLEAARPRNQSAVEMAKMALALQYLAAGQSARAEPIYEELLRSQESNPRTSPDSMVLLLVQLASLHEGLGRHDEAKRFIERALKIAEDSPVDEQTIETLRTSAGELFSKLGEYERAERLLEAAAAAAIRKDRGDGRTAETPLTVLAWHYRSRGDYEHAELAWRKVLQIRENNYGARSKDIPMTLNQLAELYWAWGKKTDQIMPLALRAADLDEANLATVLQGGSEEQKAAFVERYVQSTDRIVSYHLKYAPRAADAARLAVNTVLRRKGRVLDAVSDSMRGLRQRMSDSDREMLDKIGKVRERLASLSLSGPTSKMTPDQYKTTLAALEQEERQLQSDLAQRSASYKAGTEPISHERVASLLPFDSALVEIVAFRPFDVKYRRYSEAFGPKHYAAYVVRKDGAPEAVDLGDAAAIDASIQAFRQALASPSRADVKDLGKALHEKLFAPLRPLIGKASHLLVSPDGMVNLVPFAALADGDGKYLIESYAFTYLTSGRDLQTLQASAKPRSAPLLVGNPDFDAGGSASSDSGSGVKRSVDFARVRFGALPGTSQEVTALGKTIDSARVLESGAATEEALKKVEAPVVLHIATHGFFLADEAGGGKGARALELDTGPAARLVVPERENPLIRSGLALAGANSRKSGSEDGVLTALEVAGLDLYGTRMVVLSACETAVGEVRNGDGVYGLRRALVIAGSESQVMSLWKVDDEATRDLMVGFYKELAVGKGRSEALRSVQRTMAAESRHSHPYYWAAFIPSGSWEPMRFEWQGGTGSTRDSSSSDDSSAATTPSSYGRFTIGVGYEGLSASATDTRPELLGRSLGLTLGFRVIGGLGGKFIGIRDEARLGLQGGRATADETDTVGWSPAGMAYGVSASYTPMLGVRVPGFGLYGGVRAAWFSSKVGDVSLSGTALPWAAALSTRYVSVLGWTGKVTGSRFMRGVDVSVPIATRNGPTVSLAGSWQEVDADGKARPSGGEEVDLGLVRTSMLSLQIRVSGF